MLVMAFVLAGSASAQNYEALIDGLQETPPNASPGTGIGCFTLDSQNVFHYEITFSDLIGVENNAHVHGPAPVGVPAGIVFGLPAGSPKVGSTGPLTAGQIADLNNGLWYVNIHSTLFPGGEIRGQILVGQEACTVAVEEQSWSLVKQHYRD
jgi:hypothetical protein